MVFCHFMSLTNFVELCTIWLIWYATMCILEHYDLQSHIGEVSVSLCGDMYLCVSSFWLWKVDAIIVCGIPTNLSLNMSTIDWSFSRVGIVMALWFTMDKNWKRCVLKNKFHLSMEPRTNEHYAKVWGSACDNVKSARNRGVFSGDHWNDKINKWTKIKFEKVVVCAAVWDTWDDMKDWYTTLENFISQSCETMKPCSTIKRRTHIGVWKKPPCKKKWKGHPPWLRYSRPHNMPQMLNTFVKLVTIFCNCNLQTTNCFVDDLTCLARHPQYYNRNCCWFFLKFQIVK